MSAFEDYDIASVFSFVVITALFGILGLCTWKLLPVGEMGDRGHHIMPGLFFLEDPLSFLTRGQCFSI